MILTIDIGNTTISFAALKGTRVARVRRIDATVNRARLGRGLARVLRGFGKDFEAAVISSVVPKAAVIVEQYLRKHTAWPVLVAGRDLKVPVKNLYSNPKQVGQDRLVGAYAAMRLYGKPVIVIDLGTAITFDVVSAGGEYLGGAIVPGLRLSAESLFLKTALLPQIAIKAPKNVIGKTTRESMLSGLFYGYGSLCRGFIDLISAQLHGRPKVVMTGGHTRLMKKFVSPKIRIIDEDLVHKGLALLAGC